MSDTTDQPIEADPLGEALAAVAVEGHVVATRVLAEGPWVRVEDARRIAEDAATQAYIDVTTTSEP